MTTPIQPRWSTNGSGWLRLTELPWSQALSYELIALGKLESARLTVKGKTDSRGVRLVSRRSVDEMLSKLAAEQAVDPNEAERSRLVVGNRQKKQKREAVPT
jgi:hypothetical protein